MSEKVDCIQIGATPQWGLFMEGNSTFISADLTERDAKELKKRCNSYADNQQLIKEFRLVLGQIIDDLPTNKDWLDPQLEMAAKALIERSRK